MALALIVDEKQDGAVALGDVFRRCGYRVETTTELDAAREIMLGQMPDVVVLHETVGGKDALELLETLDLAAVIETYLVCPEPTVPLATRAMRAGVSDLFQAPVDEQRLERNLRELQDKLSADEADAAGDPCPKLSRSEDDGRTGFR